MFNTHAKLIGAAILLPNANASSSSTNYSTAKIRTYSARLRHSIHVRNY